MHSASVIFGRRVESGSDRNVEIEHWDPARALYLRFLAASGPFLAGDALLLIASSCRLSRLRSNSNWTRSTKVERETGFEPATSTLAIKSSGIVFRRAACPFCVCFIWLYSDPLERRCRSGGAGAEAGPSCPPIPSGGLQMGSRDPGRCLGLASGFQVSRRRPVGCWGGHFALRGRG
jgi:hypothetical protein